MRRAVTSAIAISILLVAARGLADVALGGHDVATIFFVSKSDDRNRVDYGIHLDERCRAASERPVFVYWRELGADGSQSTHGLNLLERPYDVARQEILAQDERGTVLAVEIGAFRARRIVIRTSGSFGRCVATASMTIAGGQAVHDHIHLALAGPGRLDHAIVHGWTETGEVREIVLPSRGLEPR